MAKINKSYKQIYIDESGTMNLVDVTQKYFIIALVLVKKPNRVKDLFRDLKKEHSCFFVSSNNKKEIHACKLNLKKKLELASILDRHDLFEVFYIKVNNLEIIEDDLYENKARAFNYLLERNFEAILNANLINKEECYELFIDNRNVAVHSLHSLEDYLYICLHTNKKLIRDIKVFYRDSLDVENIQLADFFANLLFSYLYSKKNYLNMMKRLINHKVIRGIFVFPIKKSK